MLTRVRNFGTTHGQRFPTSSTAHDAFATVAAEIERLEALDVAERAASLASLVARKAAARQVLATTLIRASSTARVLAKTHPQIDVRVQLPLPTNDRGLITLARQFASSAGPYAAQFAAHGITLAELEGRITAFEQALHQRGMGRDDRVKARADIEAAFTRAMDAVEALDVSVANSLVADPAAQSVWKRDRRVASPRRRGATPANPVPTAAADGSAATAPVGSKTAA
jgi:hypothetical protein